MQRVAQARLTSPPGLMVWTTTEVLLNEHGPLAPIWLQRHDHSATKKQNQVVRLDKAFLIYFPHREVCKVSFSRTLNIIEE